ncbi:MAG TPA: DUF4394 domain-containing protein [Pyrinomonadaceae bacterium]
MNGRMRVSRLAAGALALAGLVGALVPPGASVASAQGQNQEKSASQEQEQERRGRIAFASDREDNFEIYTVEEDGGGLLRLTTDPAEDTDPSWSPDGKRIAFTSDRDGNQNIYVIDATTMAETRLTDNAANDLDPAWSPDGSKIAFTSERNGHQDVYVMNADGTAQTRLTDSTADDFRPSWAPSGALLAFTSNRDGNDEIYRMDANGANQVNLTNNPAEDLNPSWPPGRIVFQSTRDGNDEIYIMNANGTNPQRLTNNPAFDGRPGASPDGERIAFTSDRDGNNFEIYVMTASGASQTRFTGDEANDLDPDIQPKATTSPGSSFQFGATALAVSEGSGRVTLTITRTGSTAGSATVEFATVSGSASERSDFNPAFGRLRFAAGETSKTIDVLIVDDALVESDETFSVTLRNPTGSLLTSAFTATVTIQDNDASAPTILYAVDSANNLLQLDAAAPGAVVSTNAITGLQAGESVVGIDVRPATTQLYALGSSGRLYTVNPSNGQAQLASTVSSALSGTSFGVDFNPVPDRLRVTSEADQNLRINVDNGAATVDGTLAYAAGDTNAGQDPNVVGSAYTNSFAGATVTTLYGIDSTRDTLVTQNPPNAGTLNTVGPLGVDTGNLVGFDIATVGNAAFAALNTGAASRLYRINLSTGAATLVGDIGGGSVIRALAVANQPANPIDETGFFVRQQYLDFLNREPDAEGFAFWTGIINSCGGDQLCRQARRADVSGAFFLSIEFQGTGYFVYRAYQAAYGRQPRFAEFLPDTQRISQGVVIGQPGALERMEANRREYADEFVIEQEAFRTLYDGLTNEQYVDALNVNTGGSLSAAERNALVAGLGSGTETRATVLIKVADDADFRAREFNRAFVLMQYFGYLRRNPDDPPDTDFSGYNFWLAKLNQFGGDFRAAEMVKAFITSGEYRRRFGPA